MLAILNSHSQTTFLCRFTNFVSSIFHTFCSNIRVTVSTAIPVTYKKLSFAKLEAFLYHITTAHEPHIRLDPVLSVCAKFHCLHLLEGLPIYWQWIPGGKWMAIKERNDSPYKLIGEGCLFSTPLFIDGAQLGELWFGTSAAALVGWVP